MRQSGDPKVVWGPRLRLGLVVVSCLLTLSLAGWVLGGGIGAVGVTVGSAMTAISAASAGMPAARLGAPAIVVAIVLGSLTTGDWPWVFVVSGLATVAGLTATRHAMGPMLLAAVVSTIAPETSSPAGAFWLGIFAAIGCVYGLALAKRIGLADTASPIEVTLPLWAVAAGLGAVGAVTSALAVALDDDQAYWIPMTALIVAMPTASGATERGRQRLIGTLIGAAVAAGIGLIAPPGFAVAIVVVVALFMTVATSGLAYQVQATFITIFVLLAGGAPRPDVVERRVAFTIVGTGVLMAGIFAISAITRRVAGPRDEPG